MTYFSDYGYFPTIFLATSVEACLLGEAQACIISEATILIISPSNRGLGLFPLSKHCIKASGSFSHGTWKLSTQSAAVIRWLDEGVGEIEIEEQAEDAGEVNVDWPWNSVVCAVK